MCTPGISPLEYLPFLVSRLALFVDSRCFKIMNYGGAYREIMDHGRYIMRDSLNKNISLYLTSSMLARIEIHNEENVLLRHISREMMMFIA